MLPEKVTQPIRVPATIETPASVSMAPGVRERAKNSEAATRAEAPPPNPLKAPTICGMAVIGTVRAMTSPTSPPAASPMMIQVKSTIWRSSRVATMASSIPSAAIRFPFVAVSGDWSRLRPTMNRTAESR